MKEYHVKLNAHYEKPLTIYADSPEQAAEKLKNIRAVPSSVQYAKDVAARTDVKTRLTKH